MINSLYGQLLYDLALIKFAIKHMFILVFKMETKIGKINMLKVILEAFKNR